MIRRLDFVKDQGCGNDFVIVNEMGDYELRCVVSFTSYRNGTSKNTMFIMTRTVQRRSPAVRAYSGSIDVDC